MKAILVFFSIAILAMSCTPNKHLENPNLRSPVEGILIGGSNSCITITRESVPETCIPYEYRCVVNKDRPIKYDDAVICGVLTFQIPTGICAQSAPLDTYRCNLINYKPEFTPVPWPTEVPRVTPTPFIFPKQQCWEHWPGWCWKGDTPTNCEAFGTCTCIPCNSTPTPLPPATPIPSKTATPTPKPTSTAACPSGTHRNPDCGVIGYPGSCSCIPNSTPAVTPRPSITPIVTPIPAKTPTPVTTCPPCPCLTPTPTPKPTITASPICSLKARAQIGTIVEIEMRTAVVAGVGAGVWDDSSPIEKAIWYSGEKSGDSYIFKVDAKLHGNKFGNYTANVYLWNPNTLCGTIRFSIIDANPASTPFPVPVVTPPVRAQISGTWFIGGEHKPDTYNMPNCYAVWPATSVSFWDKYQKPICPRETWNAFANINLADAPNITMDKARVAAESVIFYWNKRQEQITKAKAEGKIPPPEPIITFAESSTFAIGVSQDLWGGGHHKSDGTLIDPKAMADPLPEHLRMMSKMFQDVGIKNLMDVPYVFGWANSYPGQTVDAAGTTYFARLSQNNPKFWPVNYQWKANPITGRGLDDPTNEALLRDIFYLDRYLARIRAWHPEINFQVVQISSCGNAMPNDIYTYQKLVSGSISSLLAWYNFPKEIQIEGCSARQNPGLAWETAWADCTALKNAATDPGTIISIWDNAKYNSIKTQFDVCP